MFAGISKRCKIISFLSNVCFGFYMGKVFFGNVFIDLELLCRRENVSMDYRQRDISGFLSFLLLQTNAIISNSRFQIFPRYPGREI